MRVCYDHQVTSLQDAEGVTRYFFELIRALLQQGQVEPDWLVGLERSVFPLQTLMRPAHVLAKRTCRKPGPARYALNEAWSACAGLTRGHFDVYHTTYQRALPYFRRRALVATHHDSTPARYPELFADSETIQKRLKRLYDRADRIICISESSRKDVMELHGVPAEKTAVIHHGYSRFALDEMAQGSLAGGRPYVLYVGARHSYKNFPMLVEALAAQRHKELGLVVVGGGPLTATETELLRRLEMTGRVEVVPRATDQQLWRAYRNARMFVYPSLYEGFGFPPLEAMDAGCPAVVSRSSALPEICGDAAFYFDPGDLQGLEMMIERLQESETLRLSKREQGFEQIRKYTWQETARRTTEVYREAVAS